MKQRLFEPVKLNGDLWTFKNTKTGKLCEQRFDDADDVHEGFATVVIDNEWTFYNPSTEKLCEQRFDDVADVHGDFACVKIDGKWTFFNPSTEKLCEQRFDYVDDIHEGFAAVRIGNGLTFFNPSTEKLCEQKFDNVAAFAVQKDGFACVKVGKKWTFYNPSKDFFLSSISSNKAYSSLSSYLIDQPKEFEKLPTAFFKNKENAQACLDAIANGIKESKMEPKKVVEIYDMISNKIEKEKKNIEIAKQKEAAEKAKNTADRTKRTEIAENIKGLGGKL